jgi:glucose/arabinose dehydrogenase
VRLRLVADGFLNPLFVTGAGDGSGRLFVVEQGGRIRIVEGGRILPRDFLDISSRITAGGEQGLLGLAFHPDFRQNGLFYVDYTDVLGNTVVAQYRVDPNDPDRADPTSAKTILHVHQPYANHNGGDLAFGPDGDLYISFGDGGSEGDPEGHGQRLNTLLGKVLRIDVDHPSGGRPYGIPAGNPFANDPNARPEIWAYGLRNPWRFSFDRRTHDMWIGDVGQGAHEEIDHASAGRGGQNYGWNIMEGPSCFEPPTGCNRNGLTLPVASYTHDDGNCTVIGGYVYRGNDFPALAGTYLFADYCSGRVWTLDAAHPRSEPHQVLDLSSLPSSFGEDDRGELYVTTLNTGQLFQVTATRR